VYTEIQQKLLISHILFYNSGAACIEYRIRGICELVRVAEKTMVLKEKLDVSTILAC